MVKLNSYILKSIDENAPMLGIWIKVQDILYILRQFLVILFKFINQGISWTLCIIPGWKALDVRIINVWAGKLFDYFWKAQNFGDGARLKWQLYLKVRRRKEKECQESKENQDITAKNSIPL